ncbi:AraC-like DNA-binding protein [Algoriphagus sp. 4150]|uniref:helix-turn-helix domain-containing protein n=1 Tax=Algoriphagus sp. 4150 TaxID=2817756 RepID=UPI0028669DFC|nr:helix-turn-helix domain-containing protein [Algoriphagus sp. 4150]MDR7131997.1 AraC-like DNA-binding protein [Algoriphagus sp. 4150]
MGRNKNVEHRLEFSQLQTLERIYHRGLWVGHNAPMPELDLLSRHFRSDFFQILLFSKGNAELSINLIDHKVKSHDLLICSPYDIKKVNNVDQCSHSMVLFTNDFIVESGNGKYAMEFLKTFSTGLSPLSSLDSSHYMSINSRISELYRLYVEQEHHQYGKELLYLSFASLLFEVSAIRQKFSTTPNKPLSRKEQIVFNFVSLVKENFKDHRSLNYYASKLNISAKYLTEITKQISGKPASEIIEGIVTEEAMLLLENPSLSIGEIANILNFSDQSFFGKFFKRNSGVSPKHYRNSVVPK